MQEAPQQEVSRQSAPQDDLTLLGEALQFVEPSHGPAERVPHCADRCLRAGTLLASGPLRGTHDIQGALLFAPRFAPRQPFFPAEKPPRGYRM